VGGKIPFVGPLLANKINEQFANGGKVMAGSPVANGVAINTPSQLISLIKKAPELAQKHGLTVDMVKEAVADAKKGEMLVKARGGKMKKGLKGQDTVQLRAGHEVPHYAKGGSVLSVF
jgi:hypothetical protein